MTDFVHRCGQRATISVIVSRSPMVYCSTCHPISGTRRKTNHDMICHRGNVLFHREPQYLSCSIDCCIRNGSRKCHIINFYGIDSNFHDSPCAVAHGRWTEKQLTSRAQSVLHLHGNRITEQPFRDKLCCMAYGVVLH